MEASDYLTTIAEVSVAFVGFAAIVIAVARRSEGPDWLGMTTRWLIERGLFALFFALLPMLLVHFDLPAEQAFRVSAALLSAYFLTVVVRLYRLLFRVDHDWQISTASALARLVIVGSMFPVQSLAALGLLPFPVAGWYLAGVSWLLLICAALFGSILNRMAM